MSLEPKEVTCQCGHTFISDREKAWCQKCADPVFYREENTRRHKINNIYMLSVALLVITFLVYVFIELIADPFLSA